MGEKLLVHDTGHISVFGVSLTGGELEKGKVEDKS